MAQPAAKIPVQNRQYTTSKNSSYIIISSLQISPEAEKVKLALPASAIAILNLAWNHKPNAWVMKTYFLKYHTRFAKAWHKHHPPLFNSYPKWRERKPGLQLNPLSWHTCLERSKVWQLLHMAISDFLNLQIEGTLQPSFLLPHIPSPAKSGRPYRKYKHKS